MKPNIDKIIVETEHAISLLNGTKEKKKKIKNHNYYKKVINTINKSEYTVKEQEMPRILNLKLLIQYYTSRIKDFMSVKIHMTR